MWLSDVLGMGDYEIKDNSLMNPNSGVPNFSGSSKSVRIKHREYLGDVTSSLGFQMYSTYRINPGNSHTFPWLSRVAQNFQSYKMRGLLFEFNSTSADALASTNTALGTVVMATQYNSAAPAFLNKAEMEQYEFSCSTKPSKSLIHPVECNPEESVMDHMFVRTDTVSVIEPQFYDLGVFQLATVGMQAANINIGELWVTYDVELFKPRIDPGGTWPGQSFQVTNYGGEEKEPFGPLQRVPVGTLPLTIGHVTTGYDSIIFPNSITAGTYEVTVHWYYAVPPTSFTALVSGNLSYVNGNFASKTYLVTDDGIASLSYHAIVKVTGYNYAGGALTFAVPGLIGDFVCAEVVAAPLSVATVG